MDTSIVGREQELSVAREFLAGVCEGPFVDEPIRAGVTSGRELVSRLIDESPFVQLLTGVWPRAEDEMLEAENPGCEGELSPPDVEPEFDEEVWSGSAEQIAFRDRVLATAKQRRGTPQRDLRPEELDFVPGTSLPTRADTAAAAGRLVAAANADLALARQAGDADALRTVRVYVNSAYRSSQTQLGLWLKQFPRNYRRSQPARDKLAEGPHSEQAIDFLLKPKISGGFGLNGRIAVPGYSNHQNGIALDLKQERARGHEVPNDSDDKMRERWRRTWFHGWLRENATKNHGFRPLHTEEWHWEYRPGSTATTPPPAGASGAVSSDVVRFAQRVLNAVAGERLADDGDPGRRTRAALERFRTRLGTGGVLDARTEFAMAQRALEELAQASMFAQVGVRDAQTEQALARQTSRAAGGTTASGHLGGKLWTFTATTLPLRVAVFCPRAALASDEVEVLVFAHGLLDSCPRPKQLPSGLVTDRPFDLGRIVDASGRPMVLVVPLLDWANPGGGSAFGKGHERWHALGKPQHLGGVLGEVLAELGRVQGRAAPSIRDLVLAGHSRAYGFLEPLAHHRRDQAMQQGGLARLSQVWAFDTSYGSSHRVERWTDWLTLNPRLRVHMFYKPGSNTGDIGKKFEEHRRERLSVTHSGEGHCAIPATRLPALLSPRSAAADHEVDDEFEDLDDVDVESQADDTAFAPDDEVDDDLSETLTLEDPEAEFVEDEWDRLSHPSSSRDT